MSIDKGGRKHQLLNLLILAKTVCTQFLYVMTSMVFYSIKCPRCYKKIKFLDPESGAYSRLGVY